MSTLERRLLEHGEQKGDPAGESKGENPFAAGGGTALETATAPGAFDGEEEAALLVFSALISLSLCRRRSASLGPFLECRCLTFEGSV